MVIFEHDIILEGKIGLEIKNITLQVEHTNIDKEEFYIYGEFSMKNSSIYSRLELQGILYDDTNSILKIVTTYVDLNGFLGHGTFNLWGYERLEVLNRVKKIKIIPTQLVKKEYSEKIEYDDEIILETDDVLIKVYPKRDYGLIDDDMRENEFLSDVHFAFEKFSKSDEMKELMEYYD